jgi:hypothetical protein
LSNGKLRKKYALYSEKLMECFMIELPKRKLLDGFTFIDVKKLGERYDSTGFYYNYNVEIKVEKSKEVLKIPRFETGLKTGKGWGGEIPS